MKTLKIRKINCFYHFWDHAGVRGSTKKGEESRGGARSQGRG